MVDVSKRVDSKGYVKMSSFSLVVSPTENLILGSFICLYLGRVLMESVNTMEVQTQIRRSYMGLHAVPEKQQEFYLNNKTVSKA